MTDINTTTDLTAADATDDGSWACNSDDARASDWIAPAPFSPNYTPLAGVRILRSRLYADEGGVATVTFAGTLDEQAVWVEAGGSGRLSVYAEVTRTPDGQPP